MLTVVLCLTDIIKYNETLTHPNNRGQTNTKMVLYKHKPHLTGHLFFINLWYLNQWGKWKKRVFICLQTRQQTTNKKFLSSPSGFNFCNTDSHIVDFHEARRETVFSIVTKPGQGSHMFCKQKLHESMTLNDPNILKTLHLLCF